MSKTLRTTPEIVKPNYEAGYTIKFKGTRLHVRASHGTIMTVLRVLDQLKREGK